MGGPPHVCMQFNAHILLVHIRQLRKWLCVVRPEKYQMQGTHSSTPSFIDFNYHWIRDLEFDPFASKVHRYLLMANWGFLGSGTCDLRNDLDLNLHK